MSGQAPFPDNKDRRRTDRLRPEMSLDAMSRVARICALGLGLEELQLEVLREIVALCRADACCLASCAEDPARRDVWCYPPSRDPGVSQCLYDSGPAWDALIAKLRVDGIVTADDLSELPPDDFLRRSFSGQPVRAVMIAPLKFGTRIVGVLGIHSHSVARAWSAAEARAVREIVAPVLAAALERRSMEDRQRASEARYRILSENAPDLISLHDRDGRFRYVNPAATRLLGYRPEEMVGSPLAAFLPDGDRERVMAENLRLVAGEISVLAVQHGFRRKDGVFAQVESIATRLPAGRGDAAEVLRITRDVAMRSRMETRSQESRKLETLGMLAGGLGHEYNNLLVGIGGAAEMLEMLFPGNPEAGRYIAVIERNARRAAELTRQLLAYARQGHFRPEVTLLQGCVQEDVPLLKAALPASVELRMDLGDDVPPVLADVSLIKQVVMSLCLNAGESMSGGGVLTIRVRRDDGSVPGPDDTIGSVGRTVVRRVRAGPPLPGPLAVLDVADTGCGMGESTIARIFEPFFSTKFVGRGMGLAAVRGIVESHGGAIRVTSKERAGTTFSIFLPTVDACPVPAEPLPAAAGGTEMVLVADDEDDVRAMLRAMLESFGYRVIEAGNGATAVQLFRERRGQIDLVVLDLVMPRMTGEEAFARMRRIDPGLRGILMSGYDESGRTREIEAMGFRSFLRKPFRRGVLAQKVREALQGRPPKT